MAFCIHCGAQVAEDATFCHSCGGSVQDLTAAAPGGAEPPPSTVGEAPGWPASLEMPSSSWDAPTPEAPAASWDAPSEAAPSAWDSSPQAPAEAWGTSPEAAPPAWDPAPQAPAASWGASPEAPPSTWEPSPQPPAAAWGASPPASPSSWSAPGVTPAAPPRAGSIDSSGTGWPPSLGGPERPPAPLAPAPPQVHGAGQPVPNYLIPAVFSMLCCCLPFGVVSLVFAIQANTKAGAGLYDEALRNANLAKIWLWVAVIGGLLGNGFIIAANVLAALANA